MKRNHFIRLAALAMSLALALGGAALAEGEHYAVETYLGEDPWGGALTVTVQSVSEGKLAWTLQDVFDNVTLYQEITDTELVDGTGAFHVEGACLEDETIVYDYTGTIALSDGAMTLTFTDGQSTQTSPEGGSGYRMALALDEADRVVTLTPAPEESEK